MLTTSQLNNLRDAAKHAHTCELASNVPAELILSQWALESGWGAHSPGNNCFGIKAYPNCWGKQLLYTHEYFTPQEKDKWLKQLDGRTCEMENATLYETRQRYKVEDWFATFPDLFGCFSKRAELFSHPTYKPFLDNYLRDNNFVLFVQAVAPVYATDPGYSRDILSIASIPEVQAAIKSARANG